MISLEYIVIENDKIGRIKAKLLMDKNPETCKAIWEKLPLDLDLSRWGEELYGRSGQGFQTRRDEERSRANLAQVRRAPVPVPLVAARDRLLSHF